MAKTFSLSIVVYIDWLHKNYKIYNLTGEINLILLVIFRSFITT